MISALIREFLLPLLAFWFLRSILRSLFGGSQRRYSAPPPPPPPPTTKADEAPPDWLQRNYPEEAGGRRRRYEGPPQEVPFFEEKETGTIGLGFFRGSGSRWPPYLGPLASLGELKATQLFSHLASRFDSTAGR